MDSRVIGLILVAAMVCWAIFTVLRMRKEKGKEGKPVRRKNAGGES